MLSGDGSNRQVLRACLERRVQPLLGQALFSEYEDVMKRAELFRECAISPTERMNLLDALLSVRE